jgi:hypothetical protein
MPSTSCWWQKPSLPDEAQAVRPITPPTVPLPLGHPLLCGPLRRGGAATGRYHPRAGSVCRRFPICRIRAADRARMTACAGPTGCRRAPVDDHDAVVRVVGAAVGAGHARQPIQRQSGSPVPARVARRSQAGAADRGWTRAGRRGSERRPLDGPVATPTTGAERRAGPPVPPALVPAGAPPVPRAGSGHDPRPLFLGLCVAGSVAQHHQIGMRQQAQGHEAVPGLPGADFVVV